MTSPSTDAKYADLAEQWGPLAERLHREVQVSAAGPRWGENAYWTFWDLQAETFGHVHVMTSVNGEGRRIRVVASVDGRRHEVIEPLPLLTPASDDMQLESEHVQLWLHGRVAVATGDLGLDLTYRPLREAALYTESGVLPSLPDTAPLQHFQRSATVTGTVTVDGDVRTVAGVGVRDRTWGHRDESSSWIEYYACFLCFDEFDVAVMKYRSPHLGDRVDGHLPGRAGQIVASRAVRDAAGDLRGLELRSDLGESLGISVVGVPLARLPVHVGPDDNSLPNFSCYDEVVRVRTAEGEDGVGTLQQGFLLHLP